MFIEGQEYYIRVSTDDSPVKVTVVKDDGANVITDFEDGDYVFTYADFGAMLIT